MENRFKYLSSLLHIQIWEELYPLKAKNLPLEISIPIDMASRVGGIANICMSMEQNIDDKIKKK